MILGFGVAGFNWLRYGVGWRRPSDSIGQPWDISGHSGRRGTHEELSEWAKCGPAKEFGCPFDKRNIFYVFPYMFKCDIKLSDSNKKQ